MHLTSIHISIAQTIIPFSPTPLLINVYGLIPFYAEVWLGFRNYVTHLPMFIIRLSIGTDSALSGKSGRTPTIALGLIVFSLIQLQLKPANITMTLHRPRSAQSRMYARQVLCCFIASVRKHVKETANLGRRVSGALFHVAAKVAASAAPRSSNNIKYTL